MKNHLNEMIYIAGGYRNSFLQFHPYEKKQMVIKLFLHVHFKRVEK